MKIPSIPHNYLIHTLYFSSRIHPHILYQPSVIDIRIQSCFGDHNSTPWAARMHRRKVGAAATAAQAKRVWSLDGILWEFRELRELKRPKHAFKELFITLLRGIHRWHLLPQQRAAESKYALSVIICDVVHCKAIRGKRKHAQIHTHILVKWL